MGALLDADGAGVGCGLVAGGVGTVGPVLGPAGLEEDAAGVPVAGVVRPGSGSPTCSAPPVPPWAPGRPLGETAVRAAPGAVVPPVAAVPDGPPGAVTAGGDPASIGTAPASSATLTISSAAAATPIPANTAGGDGGHHALNRANGSC